MSDTSNEIKLWQPCASWLNKWFCNDKNTPMAQVIIAVTFGVILSPFASGLFFLVIFTVLGEILYYMFTKGDPRYYNVFTRAGVIYGGIFGYIVGRSLSNCEVLVEGVPSIPGSGSQ